MAWLRLVGGGFPAIICTVGLIDQQIRADEALRSAGYYIYAMAHAFVLPDRSDILGHIDRIGREEFNAGIMVTSGEGIMPVLEALAIRQGPINALAVIDPVLSKEDVAVLGSLQGLPSGLVVQAYLTHQEIMGEAVCRIRELGVLLGDRCTVGARVIGSEPGGEESLSHALRTLRHQLAPT